MKKKVSLDPAPQQSDSDSESLERIHLTDAELEDMWNALEQEREFWIDADDLDCKYFRLSLCGGKWLFETAGKTFDCFKVQARGKDVQDFATKYIVQYSARFPIDAFGMEVAKALTVEFCHKMDYFYSIYVDSDEESYKFTDADKEGYHETSAFKDAIESQTGVNLKRCQWLRQLMK